MILPKIVHRLAGWRWLGRRMDITADLEWLLRRCGECGWYAFRWQRGCADCNFPDPIDVQ